ncbi:GATA transcription factor 11-like [Malania oleifera]|uniref:GATA transcription factor 11-like n=1 Tax=Malania oleifera TaxID=397392 RepID=UPI0025ADECA8|nr:GATA transcription factor 11-like [Malania oleifera]
MDGGDFLGENNSASEDFLDSIINFFDFPMESVEEKTTGDDGNAGVQGLGPLPSDALLGSSSNICSNESSEILTKHSVMCNATPLLQQSTNLVGGMSNKHILPKNEPSNREELSMLQTSSPISVLESSRSSSVEETVPVCPTSYHMRSENPCPTTLNQQTVTTVVSTSSSSEKSHPLGTFESKVYSSEYLLKKNLNLVKGKRKKRKKRKLSLLSGTMETKNSLREPRVSTLKNSFPKPSRPTLPKPVATRKCTHCETTRTPQWRLGPLGPKTLCNACGVRYRSGRLYPEYRPAASPAFVESLHSNSHKKVLEMRTNAKQDSTDVVESEVETDATMSPPPEFIPMSSYLFDCIFDDGGGNFSKMDP